MEIKNNLMEILLKKLKDYKSPKKYNEIELNNFFELLIPNITKVNDFVVRNYNGNINKEYVIKTYGNMSSFEDSENHLHIIDLIDCSVIQTLKFGLMIKEILKNVLRTKFPNDKFIIVLTCDGKNKANTILRFHKYREGDGKLYNENYVKEFDTGKYATGIYIEKT